MRSTWIKYAGNQKERPESSLKRLFFYKNKRGSYTGLCGKGQIFLDATLLTAFLHERRFAKAFRLARFSSPLEPPSIASGEGTKRAFVRASVWLFSRERVMRAPEPMRSAGNPKGGGIGAVSLVTFLSVQESHSPVGRVRRDRTFNASVAFLTLSRPSGTLSPV